MGCEPKNYLRLCLLLLLKERSDHGYDLLDRLRPLGVDEDNPGVVYRALRALERSNLVVSDWSTSSVGPARRTYRLTPTGEASLHANVQLLEESRRTVDRYLDRYLTAVRGNAPAHDGASRGTVVTHATRRAAPQATGSRTSTAQRRAMP